MALKDGSPYLFSEDTLLLIKAVESLGCKDKCLEIGSGRGYVTSLLAKKCFYLIAIDVDQTATLETKRRVEDKGISSKVDVVCCKGLSAVREGKLFDAIIFNPPYLPNQEGLKDVTVDGGPEGVEVTLELLRDSLARLNKDGEVRFISSTLANLSMLLSKVSEMGVKHSLEEEIPLFFERLYVIKVKL